MLKIARYLFSGITATAMNLYITYVLTDLLGFWYIFSSVIGFVTALAVSFVMQKFWTFRHAAMERVRSEVTQFFAVAIVGLLFNTVFVYAFVEYAHTHYLLAQILAGVLIAATNFLLYHMIFHGEEGISIGVMWRERLNATERGLFIAGGISLALILIKSWGLGLSLYQDEWKTARVILEGASSAGVYFQHPPLAGLLFRVVGAILPPDLFRLMPLFFTAASYALLYLIMEARAGMRTGFLSILLLGTVAYGTIAALMFDIDGAILPSFMLMAVFLYDRMRMSQGSARGIYAVFLFFGLILGFLIKLSFVLVVGAIFLDYLYERGRRITVREFWRLGGLLGLFVTIAGLVIFFAHTVYPSFDTNGMITHAYSYVHGFHRNWAQVAFEGAKSVLYMGPLAFAWIPFVTREVFGQVRIFFIYLGLGFLFYFVLFDFSAGALDKYLMFAIVPVCAIAAVTLIEHIPRRSEWSVRYSLILVGGSLFLFALNFLPQEVLPLYPKSAWAKEVFSLHWNILIPFMGGSGPLGFYVSFLFIVSSFIAGGVLLFLALARPSSQRLVVGALLVLSILYAGVFTEEMLFGRINGSASKVLSTALHYVGNSKDITAVITHNDIGAFELWRMGKYAGRFYAVPQYEDGHRQLFASHQGQYLVVDVPRWSDDSFYAKFFSSCGALFSSSSGVISARVYVCSKAATPHQ